MVIPLSGVINRLFSRILYRAYAGEEFFFLIGSPETPAFQPVLEGMVSAFLQKPDFFHEPGDIVSVQPQRIAFSGAVLFFLSGGIDVGEFASILSCVFIYLAEDAEVAEKDLNLFQKLNGNRSQ